MATERVLRPLISCHECREYILPVQRLIDYGVYYHRNCFRCKVCHRRLNDKTRYRYSEYDSLEDVFCWRHAPWQIDPGKQNSLLSSSALSTSQISFWSVDTQDIENASQLDVEELKQRKLEQLYIYRKFGRRKGNGSETASVISSLPEEYHEDSYSSQQLVGDNFTRDSNKPAPKQRGRRGERRDKDKAAGIASNNTDKDHPNDYVRPDIKQQLDDIGAELDEAVDTDSLQEFDREPGRRKPKPAPVERRIKSKKQQDRLAPPVAQAPDNARSSTLSDDVFMDPKSDQNSDKTQENFQNLFMDQFQKDHGGGAYRPGEAPGSDDRQKGRRSQREQEDRQRAQQTTSPYEDIDDTYEREPKRRVPHSEVDDQNALLNHHGDDDVTAYDREPRRRGPSGDGDDRIKSNDQDNEQENFPIYAQPDKKKKKKNKAGEGDVDRAQLLPDQIAENNRGQAHGTTEPVANGGSPEVTPYRGDDAEKLSQVYDDHGRPLEHFGQVRSDEDGHPIFELTDQPYFDAEGRFIGRPVQQYYDENGRPVTQIGEQFYDENCRLVDQHANPLYDQDGRPIAQSGPQHFDEHGRPVCPTDQLHYCEDGRLVDPSDRQIYNQDGEPIVYTDESQHGHPLIEPEQQLFDKNGRLVKPNQDLHYDNNGRLVDESNQPLYDKHGRPIMRPIIHSAEQPPAHHGDQGSTPASQVLYDENRRPVKPLGDLHFDESSGELADESNRKLYDQHGRPITQLFDEQGREVSPTGQMRFNQDGHLVDAATGGLIIDQFGQPIVHSPHQLYDEDGRPVEATGQLHFDDHGRLVDQSNNQVFDQAGQAVIQYGQQIFDQDGNPIEHTTELHFDESSYLVDGANNPLYDAYGQPIAQSALQIYDEQGNPAELTETLHFDKQGRLLNQTNDQLYDQHGWAVSQLYDKHGEPIKSTGLLHFSDRGHLVDKTKRPLYDQQGIPFVQSAHPLYNGRGQPVDTAGQLHFNKHGNLVNQSGGKIYDQQGRHLVYGDQQLYDERGDPLDVVGELFFDEHGRLLNDSNQQVYDHGGRPVVQIAEQVFEPERQPVEQPSQRIQDEKGHQVEPNVNLHYDEHGRLVDPSNKQLYDQNGHPIVRDGHQLQDDQGAPLGHSADLHFNEQGRLADQSNKHVYDQNGRPITMLYDDKGRPVKRSGNFHINEHGSLVDQMGRQVYDKHGLPIMQSTQHLCDSNGQPTKPNAKLHFNEDGNLVDQSNNQMYDQHGRPVVIPTEKQTAQHLFDENGHPIKSTAKPHYDTHGRLVDNSNQQLYDQHGQPIAQDANQLQNEDGSPIQETGEFHFDEQGRLVDDSNKHVYDENGRPITKLYDENGRLVKHDGEFYMEEHGRLVDQESRQLYDQDGKPIMQAVQQLLDVKGQPVNSSATLHYDKDGNLVDQLNNQVYDQDGLPISSSDDSNQQLHQLLDENGRPVQLSLQAHYDDRCRLVDQSNKQVYAQNGLPIVLPVHQLQDENGDQIKQSDILHLDEQGALRDKSNKNIYGQDGQPITKVLDESGQLVKRPGNLHINEQGFLVDQANRQLCDPQGRPFMQAATQQLFHEDGKPVNLNAKLHFNEDGCLVDQYYKPVCDPAGYPITTSTEGRPIEHLFDEYGHPIPPDEPVHYDQHGFLVDQTNKQLYDVHGHQIVKKVDHRSVPTTAPHGSQGEANLGDMFLEQVKKNEISQQGRSPYSQQRQDQQKPQIHGVQETDIDAEDDDVIETNIDVEIERLEQELGPQYDGTNAHDVSVSSDEGSTDSILLAAGKPRRPKKKRPAEVGDSSTEAETDTDIEHLYQTTDTDTDIEALLLDHLKERSGEKRLRKKSDRSRSRENLQQDADLGAMFLDQIQKNQPSGTDKQIAPIGLITETDIDAEDDEPPTPTPNAPGDEDVSLKHIVESAIRVHGDDFEADNKETGQQKSPKDVSTKSVLQKISIFEREQAKLTPEHRMTPQQRQLMETEFGVDQSPSTIPTPKKPPGFKSKIPSRANQQNVDDIFMDQVEKDSASRQQGATAQKSPSRIPVRAKVLSSSDPDQDKGEELVAANLEKASGDVIPGAKGRGKIAALREQFLRGETPQEQRKGGDDNEDDDIEELDQEPRVRRPTPKTSTKAASEKAAQHVAEPQGQRKGHLADTSEGVLVGEMFLGEYMKSKAAEESKYKPKSPKSVRFSEKNDYKSETSETESETTVVARDDDSVLSDQENEFRSEMMTLSKDTDEYAKQYGFDVSTGRITPQDDRFGTVTTPLDQRSGNAADKIPSFYGPALTDKPSDQDQQSNRGKLESGGRQVKGKLPVTKKIIDDKEDQQSSDGESSFENLEREPRRFGQQRRHDENTRDTQQGNRSPKLSQGKARPVSKSPTFESEIIAKMIREDAEKSQLRAKQTTVTESTKERIERISQTFDSHETHFDVNEEYAEEYAETPTEYDKVKDMKPDPETEFPETYSTESMLKGKRAPVPVSRVIKTHRVEEKTTRGYQEQTTTQAKVISTDTTILSKSTVGGGYDLQEESVIVKMPTKREDLIEQSNLKLQGNLERGDRDDDDEGETGDSPRSYDRDMYNRVRQNVPRAFGIRKRSLRSNGSSDNISQSSPRDHPPSGGEDKKAITGSQEFAKVFGARSPEEFVNEILTTEGKLNSTTNTPDIERRVIYTTPHFAEARNEGSASSADSLSGAKGAGAGYVVRGDTNTDQRGRGQSTVYAQIQKPKKQPLQPHATDIDFPPELDVPPPVDTSTPTLTPTMKRRLKSEDIMGAQRELERRQKEEEDALYKRFLDRQDKEMEKLHQSLVSEKEKKMKEILTKVATSRSKLQAEEDEGESSRKKSSEAERPPQRDSDTVFVSTTASGVFDDPAKKRSKKDLRKEQKEKEKAEKKAAKDAKEAKRKEDKKKKGKTKAISVEDEAAEDGDDELPEPPRVRRPREQRDSDTTSIASSTVPQNGRSTSTPIPRERGHRAGESTHLADLSLEMMDDPELQRLMGEERDRLEETFAKEIKARKRQLVEDLAQSEQKEVADLVDKHTRQMLMLRHQRDRKVYDRDTTALTREYEQTVRPPIKPPRTKKVHFCENPTVIFMELDEHVIKVAHREPQPSSFTDLVRELTEGCKNEMEKVRAIFRWITIKNLNQMEFEDVDPDTPLGLLRGIKLGRESYHVLFKRLCGYAGLHCEIIYGFSKGEGYKPGKPLTRRYRNIWTAAHVDGSWRFINCHWGARRSHGQRKSTIFGDLNDLELEYKYEEVYFLTDPEEHVQQHFPDEPKWQLLESPLTMEDFVRQPVKKTPFFNHQLSFVEKYDAVITTKTGDVTVLLRCPTKGINFAAKLDSYYGTATLTGQVDVKVKGSEVVFDLQVPLPNICFLHIFTNEENACSFQIQAFEIPASFQRLYPGCPYFGLTLDGAKMGVVPSSQTEPFLVNNSGGDLEVRLSLTGTKRIKLMHRLLRADDENNIYENCDRFALQQRRGEKISSFLIRTFRTDFYIFEINAAPEDDLSHGTVVYRVLIECSVPSNEPDPFPIAFHHWNKAGRLHHPTMSELEQGNKIPFKVEVPTAQKVAVVVGNEWNHLALVDEERGVFEGTVYTGDRQGKLKVYGKINNKFQPMLEYKVRPYIRYSRGK